MERTALVYFVILTAIILLAIFRTFLEKTSRWGKVFSTLHVVEVGMVAVLLGSLIFFGGLQIFLRNFFHRGIIWADPLMRHVVLWLGCLGGAMATTRVRHISIDVLTRLVPERFQSVRDRSIHLATAIASSLLGLAALRLVIDEKSFGDTAFLEIKVWVLMAILPFAFFLISYRSFFNMFTAAKPKPIDWEDLGSATPPPDDSAAAET